MNEKGKVFSKKYSQKKPPSNYTGIEGGGIYRQSDQGTTGLAAGTGQPGGGSKK
jgi:hypothetical protein